VPRVSERERDLCPQSGAFLEIQAMGTRQEEGIAERGIEGSASTEG
jgi:hypothetical protein